MPCLSSILIQGPIVKSIRQIKWHDRCFRWVRWRTNLPFGIFGVSCHFGIFRIFAVCHLNADFFLLIFVHVFKMTAQDSALRECLGAMSTGIWFSSSVLSKVNVHVAALSECTATAINQALECSLVPVSLWVHYTDSLAHRFINGSETLLLLTRKFFTLIVRWLV